MMSKAVRWGPRWHTCSLFGLHSHKFQTHSPSLCSCNSSIPEHPFCREKVLCLATENWRGHKFVFSRAIAKASTKILCHWPCIPHSDTSAAGTSTPTVRKRGKPIHARLPNRAKTATAKGISRIVASCFGWLLVALLPEIVQENSS